MKQANQSNSSSGGMSITAALSQLKDEILALQDEQIRQGRAPMFSIDEGELELKLVAKREISADGEATAEFKLLLVDGDASVSGGVSFERELTQTLRVKFRALRPSTVASTEGIKFGGKEPEAKALSPAFKTDQGPTGTAKP